MKKNYINSCLLILLVSLSVSILNGQSHEYVPGQVLVKLKPGKTSSQRTALRSQIQGTVLKTFPQLGVELWRVGDSRSKMDVQSIIKEYQDHPDIEFIEPDYIVSNGANIPNDPSFSSLWAQNNTGQTGGTADADIDAPEAWDIATESSDVVIAVIDSGIDWAHEDLVDNIWQNLGEDADGDGRVLEWNGSSWIFDPGDENNIDDDGNGFADDFVGWDFHNNDNNPFDDNYHGTHVAGTIGARGNNNLGVAGVTWNVQLAAVKFLDAAGRGRISNGALALNYAVTMGMPISNNSWGGGGFTNTMYQALQNAEARGHLFFAAAGNDYGNNNDISPFYPCGYDTDNVVSVASTDHLDGLSVFSNVGPTTVDLAAPGSSIYSTIPSNGYGIASGTSMATPQVAGACALLWSLYENKSAAEIKEALLNSTDKIAALNGTCLSDGRLNVYNALTYFGTPPATCRSTDSLILVALYNSTNGDDWASSWNLNQSMTTWNGVTLNSSGCVEQLDLPNNQLDGSIPTELGNLNKLKILNLSENQLTQSIPSSLGDLNTLTELYLNNNLLGGTIPSSLGNLYNLKQLHLNNNNLSGSIPSLLGSMRSLSHLVLSFNGLTGSIPFPIGSLSLLNELHLNDNNLSGSIPITIGNLSNLTTLFLQNNQLSGCYALNLARLCSQLQQASNADISDGNNLDASWEDFCNNDDGACPIDDSCRFRDSLTLVNLYNTNGGSQWIVRWNFNQPINLWEGVTLDENECVVDLILSYNRLTGTIPSELGSLSNLETLVLTGNNLTGSIPSSLSDLDQLVDLSLQNNDLSGNIPSSLAKLTNLSVMALYGNNLSGNIPSQFGNLASLTKLLLQDNNLDGSIPSELGNLSNLIQIALQNNMLTGGIPASIGNLNNLALLRIHDNQLSGCYNLNLRSLCSSLGNIWGVNSIVSDGNNFDAPWEDFCSFNAGACTIDNSCRYRDSLALISLYNSTDGPNWDEKWILSNPMSSWYGVATNEDGCVIRLSLEDNGLDGTIPSELDNLSNLNSLILNLNSLSGSIPSSLGNLTDLKYLNLSGNDLTGNIPTSIANLNTLTELNLTNNMLTGNIPASLSNLTNLELLALYSNQLSGSVPPELGSLQNLTRLLLQDNNLSGPIPSELADISILKQLGLSNNNLTGTIPEEFGNLSSLTLLRLFDNNLSGCYSSDLAALCSSLPPSLGNNYYISNGNNFDASWENFCSSGAGTCGVASLVWPGDFNEDGKADNADVLYWGLAEANTGPTRPNASTNWEGQPSPDWPITVNDINGKHQDADGNGVVDIQDLQALIDNYGRTSELSNSINRASTVDFRLEVLNSTTSGAQTTLEYALYAEQNGAPANIHGAACSIVFNDFNFITAGINIINSSLEPDEKVVFANGNKIDIALTRTDRVNKVCSSPIAKVIAFISTEDLSSVHSFSLSVNNGKMLKADGSINFASNNSLYGVYSDVSASNDNMLITGSVEHVQCLSAGSAEVTISGGMSAYSIEWNTGSTSSKINNLSPGLYTVTVSDSNGLTESLSIEVEGQYLPIYDETGNLISCQEFACQTVIDFLGGLPNGSHHASQAINTDALVQSGYSSTLKAGNIIRLLPGFEVQIGSTFNVEIEACGN